MQMLFSWNVLVCCCQCRMPFALIEAVCQREREKGGLGVGYGGGVDGI